ncbi:MAG: sigma 54-interacting transcriptional regulator [Polyangiaceae bacterium]
MRRVRGDETLPEERGQVGGLCLIGLVGGSSFVGRLPAHGRVTIGRGGDAGVVLDHPSISRLHASLLVGESTCTVEDLASRNGTAVRGKHLRPGERSELFVGDALELGPITLALQIDRSQPEDVAPSSSLKTRRNPAQARITPRAGSSAFVAPPAGSRLAEVLALADRVAVGTISVLVQGETGSGKEILAERIHRASPRAAGPLVRFNVAAVPEQLLESELFGHERGAFTGAQSQGKVGLLEAATGGTVFLDEVGELPLPLQAKLLRALGERVIMRVGGVQPRPIDVRIVSATNRDLAREAKGGGFRADLYYRLAGVTLTVPPLRERRDEIASLARHFAECAARELGRARAPHLTEESLAQLTAHAFPGNVRELRNIVERAVLLCSGDRLDAEDVRLADAPAARPLEDESPPAPESLALSKSSLREQLSEVERGRILGALEECAGNQTRAAQLIGMPRATFVKRLDAYGIARPRKR